MYQNQAGTTQSAVAACSLYFRTQVELQKCGNEASHPHNMQQPQNTNTAKMANVGVVNRVRVRISVSRG